MEEGKFISGNSITGYHVERIRDEPVIRGNGNWNIGINTISNSCDQRTLRQFFIRPDLFIEIRDEPATFRPELQVPKTQILRQHLNVRIVNRGKGVATNSSAKFRTIRWAENRRHPSTDSKLLRWNEGSVTKTIYPRGEEEILNVVFAFHSLTDILFGPRIANFGIKFNNFH